MLGKNRVFSENKILKQCPHYLNLEHEDQEWLISKLPEFYALFDSLGYVPEEQFDEILSEREHIDNTSERKGKALNYMVTIRQRCLIIDNNMLEQHKRAREEQRAAVNSSNKKKPKSKKCPVCLKIRSLELNWESCRNNGCPWRCCPNCIQALPVHEDACTHGEEKQPKRKKQRNT